MKKLFRVTFQSDQDPRHAYDDKYSSFIVVAENEKEARDYIPHSVPPNTTEYQIAVSFSKHCTGHCEEEPYLTFISAVYWWTRFQEDIRAEEIGYAREGLQNGMIISSSFETAK